MSALESLTQTPFKAAQAPAAASSSLSTLTSATPAISTGTAPGAPSLASLTAKPFAAPAAAPAPKSPYFEGYEPSGTFIGIGTSTDPYSGRPYLAYRVPGATATSTDYTRTAPKVNPETAAPTPRDSFTNPRMPESASQDVRKVQGATADEQLDHRMALAVGGSNNAANLKLIPKAENQAAGSQEGQLSADVSAGKMSLFQAQVQEAQNKGLPAPFVDAATPPAKKNLLQTVAQAPDDSLLGVFRNTILGLPAAVATVAKATASTVAGVAEGVVKQYTQPSALEQSLEGGAQASGPIAAVNKAVLRTIVPMVEPLINDTAASIIFNTPELYNDYVQHVASGDYEQPGAQGEGGRNILGAVGKTPAQIVGDTAQAVLGAYFPEVFGESMSAFAAKGLLPAIGTTIVQGGTAGFAFGSAQAASSGSTDPKEIASIILQSTVAGAMLTLVTAGLTHGVARTAPELIDAIKQRLPDLKKEAQRGFIKNPFHEEPVAPAGGEVPEPAAAAENAPAEQQKKDEETKPAASIDEHTAAIQQKYAGNADIQQHLDEIKAELLDLSSPGFRSFREDSGDFFTEASTFPKWIPEELRSKDLFQKVFGGMENVKDIKYPTNPRAVKQRELYDHILNTLDYRAGVDTSTERGAILKAYDDAQTAREGAQGSAAAGDRSAGGSKAAGDGGPKIKIDPHSSLAELALSQKSPDNFYIALTPGEQSQLMNLIDPDGRGYTLQEAAHAFYSHVQEHIGPRDRELPAERGADGKPTSRTARRTEPQGKKTNTPRRAPGAPHTQESKNRSSYTKNNTGKAGPTEPVSIITEHNGGVEPPENKGGLQAPAIDWSQGKDLAAIRQSTDTLERTLEKSFPKETADKLNEFLTQADRHNEADKARFVSALRKETKAAVVDKLGIKAATTDSALVQRYGEGRISLDELKAQAPKTWENITKASDYFRSKYDDLISRWNAERVKAGLKPITKRANYFRHFMDLTGWTHMYGLNFREADIPTEISGITEFFRSQSPWTNAAMRRLGSETTDDAVGGFDNYIDSVSRAIFHTDTVQRGRLVEKYLRASAAAITDPDKLEALHAEGKDAPAPIKLPKLAMTLKQWTDRVSGKQNIFDRSLEAMVGRPSLAIMRTLTRQFGLNVIGGNVSSAITHAIPFSYTLATVDKGAALRGLVDTLHSPFLEDSTKINGVPSDFLARRFAKEEIERTLGEKAAAVLSAPFGAVDRFISRFAVASKYMERVAAGLTPEKAMLEADNYASRVIGDRSSGNLPPIMSTKTLGWLTQFQIEVNDNIHVLTHDIPRWEGYNPKKIAGRFIQFAIYSFLFNQAMQVIKGSGKGLDPIDMGLTLAGLNDEGHDQTVAQRLKLVGTDFLKELPFTSVVTGGQIPALQPLAQAVQDAAAGSPLKGLEQVLASFASPIGGGTQFNKTLSGIEAWRQGYVTDAQGNVIATVPHTLPQLAQGALFGTNAFPSVKKSKSEIANLDATIKEGQAAGKLKNQQAANIWQQLKGMSADAAKAQLQQIATDDPDMAKRVLQEAKDDAAGITKTDTLLKSLGVNDGARAQYIVQQLNGMSSDDQKKQYLLDLATKKILTSQVLTQIVELMKK